MENRISLFYRISVGNCWGGGGDVSLLAYSFFLPTMHNNIVISVLGGVVHITNV